MGLGFVACGTLEKTGHPGQAFGIPAWKRGFDLCVVLLLFPCVLVPMLLIACLIKLVSKGPVFFGQPRIGYRGRPFTCWKFRTMNMHADHSAHECYTRRLINGTNLPMQKLDLCGDP